jgi:hypothetical protein
MTMPIPSKTRVLKKTSSATDTQGSAESCTTCAGFSGYQSDASSKMSAQGCNRHGYFVCKYCSRQQKHRKSAERRSASRETSRSNNRGKENQSAQSNQAQTFVQQTVPKKTESAPKHPSKKEPEVWFIPFDGISRHPKRAPLNSNTFKRKDVRNLTSSIIFSSGEKSIAQQDNGQLSLQDAFKQRCSRVYKRSESRLNYISAKRNIRKQTAERRIATASNRLHLELERLSQDRGNANPAHSVAQVHLLEPKRVFTHKEMRRHTERIYSQLPEVRDKIKLKKKADNERVHRLMAQVYTTKVKQQTLRGRTDFPITKNLIVY